MEVNKKQLKAVREAIKLVLYLLDQFDTKKVNNTKVMKVNEIAKNICFHHAWET